MKRYLNDHIRTGHAGTDVTRTPPNPGQRSAQPTVSYMLSAFMPVTALRGRAT